MIRFIKFFLFFFLISTVSNAQNFDFGKVSKVELEEKVHPRDTSANAAYLYKSRKTFYEFNTNNGFEVFTEIHERVKIYNKEGFDYATKQIRKYVSGSTKEKISGLKAVTYNLVNNKIEETKLKKDGVFNTEISKYREETKFTLPNVKEGCVLEYKYRITSPFIYNVDDFILQSNIPINKMKAKFSAPEYYNFKVNTKGFLMIAPKTYKKNKALILDSKTGDKLDYYDNIYEYDLDNVPALKEEPYVNNINNYRSMVKYELSHTSLPNSTIKYYSTTWKDVIKTIYDSPNFGTELSKNGYYEEDVDALIGSVSNPMERAALIFNLVKSKVKWNGYYSYYTNDGVRRAYKDHTGNIAEINLMLTSMLRYAGLDANPVLVSTRGNGVPLFPTREGYNYVIAGVNTSKGVILLDASSKYSMPNILPTRALNWEGRMIKKNGTTSLINLYPNQPSSEVVSMNVTLASDGNIDGAIRKVKTLHKARVYRERYNEVDEDEYIEKLENRYNGMEISDFEVKNAKDLEKTAMETFKFVLENQADVIGDKIYFSPMFFLKTTKNPFKLEKREFPIDFRYPSTETNRIMIKLPEGYAVEFLPESKVVNLPEGLGSFKYGISNSPRGIQLQVKTTINSALVSPVYYESLKEYFKLLVEKENEKIVLTKV